MTGDNEQGGGEAAGVRFFLQSRLKVGVALRCGDGGGYSPHGTGPGGFQDQVARRLTGRLPRRRTGGRWEYTSTETVIDEAGFDTMETFIRKIQNTVTQYIATGPILDLCEAAARKRGARLGMWWWEQAVMDMTGVQETEEASEGEEEDGLEY